MFIALPAFGQINTTTTTSSIVALLQAFRAKGIRDYFATMSFPDIVDLRNMLLTIWYDRVPQSTHCLMIDADMGFPPELVLDQLDFDKPLVGCLYPKRRNPIDFVGRGKLGHPNLDRGFIEVEGIGFGVTLIRRDCVDALLEAKQAHPDGRLAQHVCGAMLKENGCERIIQAFNRIEVETGVLSEDISFCKRHRDAGGQVWAAAHHPITHVGPCGYTGRFLDRLTAVPSGSA